MNKPLSEWTLAEVKAECVKRNSFCEADGTCPFFVPRSEKLHCKIMNDVGKVHPKIWDLSEPPCWTEQDKEDAKAVRHLMPWATKVGRGRDYDSLMLNSSVGLHRDLFPSLKPGESATLDEIIGGGE